MTPQPSPVYVTPRSPELRLTGSCHECGGVGPVVIVQCDTDPGDMGEPRIVSDDDETIVFVPSFDLWPGDEYAEATNAAMNYGDGYAEGLKDAVIDVERLARVREKAARLRQETKRTAISSEDWRFLNGYEYALSDLGLLERPARSASIGTPADVGRGEG